MGNCPYCASAVELVTVEAVYLRHKTIAARRLWRCVMCDAYVGCHKGSDRPLGTLANGATRRARNAVHKIFDRLWHRGVGGAFDGRRGAAYRWLAEQIGIEVDACHIAMFDEQRCHAAIAAVQAKILEVE